MPRLSLVIFLLFASGIANAAKVGLLWVNPTHNIDGSPITNLAYIRIEWGSCNGSEFGTYQAAIIVNTTTPGATTGGFAYPSGLSKACFRAFAVNTAAAVSAPSNTAWKDLLPTTGKPVTLGQPVILNFVQPDEV